MMATYCQHPGGPCGRRASVLLRNKRDGKTIWVCSGCSRGLRSWYSHWEVVSGG